MDKKLKRSIIAVVSVIGLTFFSLVFQIVDIQTSVFPEYVGIQFSALPELLGACAFGPLVGVGIVFFKNFFYYWIMQCTIADVVPNVILDSLFVVIASIMFIVIPGGVVVKENKAGEKVKKIWTRKKRVLISGISATLVCTLLSNFVIKFVAIPLLLKFTDATEAVILAEFTKIPQITTLSNGVLIFGNLVTFGEYLIATVISAFIYKPVSHFMHGRFVTG